MATTSILAPNKDDISALTYHEASDTLAFATTTLDSAQVHICKFEALIGVQTSQDLTAALQSIQVPHAVRSMDVAVQSGSLKLAIVTASPLCYLFIYDLQSSRFLFRSKSNDDQYCRFVAGSDVPSLQSYGSGLKFWNLEKTFTGNKMTFTLGKFGSISVPGISDLLAASDTSSRLISTFGPVLAVWNECVVERIIVRASDDETFPIHDGGVEFLRRFYSKGEQFLVTGGADGFARIFSEKDILEASVAPVSIGSDKFEHAVICTPVKEIQFGPGVHLTAASEVFTNVMFVGDATGFLFEVDLESGHKRCMTAADFYLVDVVAVSDIAIGCFDDGSVRTKEAGIRMESKPTSTIQLSPDTLIVSTETGGIFWLKQGTETLECIKSLQAFERSRPVSLLVSSDKHLTIAYSKGLTKILICTHTFTADGNIKIEVAGYHTTDSAVRALCLLENTSTNCQILAVGEETTELVEFPLAIPSDTTKLAQIAPFKSEQFQLVRPAADGPETLSIKLTDAALWGQYLMCFGLLDSKATIAVSKIGSVSRVVRHEATNVKHVETIGNEALVYSEKEVHLVPFAEWTDEYISNAANPIFPKLEKLVSIAQAAPKVTVKPMSNGSIVIMKPSVALVYAADDSAQFPDTVSELKALSEDKLTDISSSDMFDLNKICFGEDASMSPGSSDSIQNKSEEIETLWAARKEEILRDFEQEKEREEQSFANLKKMFIECFEEDPFSVPYIKSPRTVSCFEIFVRRNQLGLMKLNSDTRKKEAEIARAVHANEEHKVSASQGVDKLEFRKKTRKERLEFLESLRSAKPADQWETADKLQMIRKIESSNGYLFKTDDSYAEHAQLSYDAKLDQLNEIWASIKQLKRDFNAKLRLLYNERKAIVSEAEDSKLNKFDERLGELEAERLETFSSISLLQMEELQILSEALILKGAQSELYRLTVAFTAAKEQLAMVETEAKSMAEQIHDERTLIKNIEAEWKQVASQLKEKLAPKAGNLDQLLFHLMPLEKNVFDDLALAEFDTAVLEEFRSHRDGFVTRIAHIKLVLQKLVEKLKSVKTRENQANTDFELYERQLKDFKKTVIEKLNAITIWIPLRPSQISASLVKNGKLQTDGDRVLLQDTELVKLYQMISRLEKEIDATKDSTRTLKLQAKNLRTDNEQKAELLNERLEELNMLKVMKFGHVVDLDELLAMRYVPEVEERRSELVSEESEYVKQIREIESKKTTAEATLLELLKHNTALKNRKLQLLREIKDVDVQLKESETAQIEVSIETVAERKNLELSLKEHIKTVADLETQISYLKSKAPKATVKPSEPRMRYQLPALKPSEKDKTPDFLIQNSANLKK